MGKKVFVYDPTASDKLSSVRGIGRYLQILKENFNNEFKFISDLGSVTPDPYSVFINPFFNFLQPPVRSNHDWTLQKRIAKKQIAVIHDLIPLKYPSHFPPGIKGSIYILLNKFALKNYDLIVTDSEASKRDIVDMLKIKSEKIKVIYPCLPKAFIKNQDLDVILSFPPPIGVEGRLQRESRLKSPNKDVIIDWIPFFKGMTTKPYCLYVGDATWNKNLVNLARAIKIANIPCIFVGKVFSQGKVTSEETLREAEKTSAVGERSGKTAEVNNGWQSEYQQFIEEVKDDKRFIFPGFVADSDLIKLYQQASMNILPSRDEGFGFSYVESSQFGCPSLLSDIPVLKEISDGKAIFFNPNDPQEIADKIKEINSNQILRNKIGVDAKKRSEFFSAKKFKEEFLFVVNNQ